MRNSQLNRNIMAGVVALSVAILLVALSRIVYGQFSWLILLLTPVLVFIGYLVLEQKVYRKLVDESMESIYRTIISLRSRSRPIIQKAKSGDQLSDEIKQVLSEWEKENQEAIDHLKELEVFRREFLGNVSHELKTPIFTVQGYIHTLMEGGIDDPDVNTVYLGKAAKGIDRLITIVEDLESISRIEAGELTIEFRTFNVNDLSREVLESLENRAAERKIKLTLNNQAEEDNYVYADKERIRQVLINLVENSIKYGNEGGHTIVTIDDHNSSYTVSVMDNGIGIDRKHLPRLFERFYRVDKSRSRAQGGTGLGLAIVKHILEKHQEQIEVDSEPGKGTTFIFTLKKSN
jgi:two-component system, OmpR family, phosphate regulon sensor histidine kinase PhoR